MAISNNQIGSALDGLALADAVIDDVKANIDAIAKQRDRAYERNEVLMRELAQAQARIEDLVKELKRRG